MEDVNKRQRIFPSLSKLECGPTRDKVKKKREFYVFAAVAVFDAKAPWSTTTGTNCACVTAGSHDRLDQRFRVSATQARTNPIGISCERVDCIDRKMSSPVTQQNL